MKRGHAILTILLTGLVLMTGAPLTTKANTTTNDEQVMDIIARNTAYRTILQDNQWGLSGESTVKEVTTGQIVIKVGDAWGANTENIDKLLATAGYNYKSTGPSIFYGEKLKMDTAYLMPACGVGVHDANTQKLLDFLYVADNEWADLLKQKENGTLAGQYGTSVFLAEEATGLCFYARGEKAGNTTITIPEYPLASGETITVKIPVLIEPCVSNDVSDDDVEETEPAAKGSIIKDKNGNKYIVTKSLLKNGTISFVESGKKKANTVKILNTVEINGITYKVTSIEKNAFKNNKYIKKVIMEDNINTIGENAFSGCTKLKTVTLGKNVTAINSKAFYKCTSLTSITIPSKVKKIGVSTFQDCKKLKSLTIKTELLKSGSIGKKAFKGIKNNATIRVSKSKFKAYKTILYKNGVSPKAKFKKS